MLIEDWNPYQPSKAAATTDKKGVISQYLGVLTPPLKAFLLSLGREHPNTLEINFTETAASQWKKAEITATVKSHDQNKIDYVRFMLEKEHERIEKEKAEAAELRKQIEPLTKLLDEPTS